MSHAKHSPRSRYMDRDEDEEHITMVHGLNSKLKASTRKASWEG